MSRFPDTRSPSGQRPEPKPANVAPAANAAGSLTSAAPSRSCPRYEPTWRRPSQLPSGESNSRLSLAPESSRPDAPVTWTPVDSSALRRSWFQPCGVAAKARHRGLMAPSGSGAAAPCGALGEGVGQVLGLATPHVHLEEQCRPSRHWPSYWIWWVTAPRRSATAMPVLVKRSSGSSTRSDWCW
jgi:hypothetical protein